MRVNRGRGQDPNNYQCVTDPWATTHLGKKIVFACCGVDTCSRTDPSGQCYAGNLKFNDFDPKSWYEATNVCAEENKVLCGVDEPCSGSGCWYDSHYQWTGEECQADDAGLPAECASTVEPIVRVLRRRRLVRLYQDGRWKLQRRRLEETFGHLGAREVVGRHELLRDARQDPLRFVRRREVPRHRLLLQQYLPVDERAVRAWRRGLRVYHALDHEKTELSPFPVPRPRETWKLLSHSTEKMRRTMVCQRMLRVFWIELR